MRHTVRNSGLSSQQRKTLSAACDAFCETRWSDDDVLSLLIPLCEAHESPVSTEMLKRIAQKDYLGIAKFQIDPNDYSDPENYFRDRQITELLRKYPFKGFAKDARAAAMDSLVAAEKRCFETNVRLVRNSNIPFTPESVLIPRMRSEIKKILGPFNPKMWLENCRFGPGSTLSSENAESVGLEFKFSNTLTLTPVLLPFTRVVLNSIPSWSQSLGSRQHEVVEGNRITTVPKTALTDRPIAIEPSLNCFLQLGLGAMIRSRLARDGLKLNDQQEENAKLARAGSIDGSLATIDLKAASDTVASKLVELIMPKRWLHALELCRSPWGSSRSNGSFRYEKWSSMGNGYTFELESLIFWALTKVCCPVDSQRAVYGDDIIVETQYVDSLISALDTLGFEVNSKKSFTKGFFRESCGSDYLSGVNVRPIYITKKVNNGPKVLDLANRIGEVASRRGDFIYRDDWFRPLWQRILSRIPRSVRLAVSTPPGVPGGLWKGDLHPPLHSNDGLTRFNVIGTDPIRTDASLLPGLLTARLSGVVGGNRSVLRGRVRFKFKRITFLCTHPGWGPWL